MRKGLVSTERFLEGGGHMGQLIREKDWTQTPLGCPAAWPQSLKTCIRIILTSRQPMFVWWGNDLINIYNDAYLSIIGGKHPEALGQPASEVWSEIWDEIGVRAAIVMNENRGTYDESLLLLMERNGYTEETYYTFSYSPVPGDDGTTQGIICANTDDTQAIIGARQLNTLKDLAKSILNINSNEAIFSRALESLKGNLQDFPFVILYLVSKDGTALKRAQHYPHNLPQALCMPDVELEQLDHTLSEWAACIQTGEIQKVSNLHHRFGQLPSGVWKDAPNTALLIPIKQSNRDYPFGILCIGINPYRLLDQKYLDFFSLVGDQMANALTNAYAFEQERKRAASLAEIDKAKTIFFNNISHEFRTPLTLMLGPLEEVLLNDAGLPTKVQENVEITHRNAMRLLKLVNGLLDFSRIESGRLHAQFQKVNLLTLTSNYASAFRSLIEKAGIRFKIIGEIDSEVYVDVDMWEKVVLNLISNAFKHTFSGTISIQLREQDGTAYIAFSDTGVGIPSAEMPRLFERFHRVKQSGGRSYEGTGIGLSLVKELVMLHHGKILVDSKIGEGTTFTIELPTGKEHLDPVAIMASAALSNSLIADTFIEESKLLIKSKTIMEGQNSHKPKVLIADDNLDMQEYISRLLAPHYAVYIASNGQEALELLAEDLPDLVVSDIMMPVMNGIELLHHIKNNPHTQRLPVLFLSARAGEEAKIGGIELGADDYLIKPFSAKELLARIRSLLGLSQKRLDYEQRLNNLFAQAPIAICILRGPDFIVELANKGILKLWEKAEQDVLGRPLKKVLPESESQGFTALLTNVYQTGEAFVAQEHPFEINRDNERKKIYVKFVYAPLRETDGTISGIVVIADDVTQHVIARTDLEINETRYKLAIEAAELASYELDIATSKFIYSDRLLQLFGLPINGIFDHADFATKIHPDDRQLRDNAHLNAYETGVLFYESRVVWPDNSIRWLRFNGRVIFDDYSKPWKIFGTALDISEHKVQAFLLEQKVEERTQILKKRNQELRESEERYQRMTEEVQDYVIIMMDKNGTILNWNKGAEKIKGYLEDEIVGKNFRIFYRPEDVSSKLPEKLIAEATLHGRAITEGYRVRKDGTLFWGSIAITALHDSAGNVIAFSKVTRDLSERKIAEDQMIKYNTELEFQNRELEQFAYVASHDLQEPLRKIQMFSGLLESNYDNAEVAKRYFSKINSTADRMSQLIKSVLNYSRLSRNDQQFEKVNLNDILQNVLIDFELLIEEKGAQIEHAILPEITAIPLQINQLFYNLIGNSLKFSDVNPSVTISSRQLLLEEIPFNTNLPQATYLELVFKDNGIGFEQKYVDKIFTIFQRLNDRVSYSGTGIGLALCKKIIENHQGYITAVSAPGKGASFTIYLPI